MQQILSMVEEQSMRVEAGMNNHLYVFDFQTQRGFKSQSYTSTIEREDAMFEEHDLEPIGQKTKIAPKWSNRIWQQGDNFQTHWDDEISPGESVPDNAKTDYGCSPELEKHLQDRGFVADESLPGTFKRGITQDTSTLAAYGYYVRTDEFLTVEGGKVGDTWHMQSAFNVDDIYIGTPEDAKYICEERGIMPQPISDKSNVCSIGWCERDQKWYGWSHRAMFGFKPGHKVTREQCGFRPSNGEEAVESIKRWHEDSKSDVSVKLVDEDDKSFKVQVQFVNHDSKGRYIPQLNAVEEVKRGRGEYTLEDKDACREAAIHFAESVSSTVINPLEHTSGLISESAKKLNVLNYAWYKFAGTRDKHYRDHNPRYELSVSKGLVFGIRYSDRTNTVYLVVEDTPGEEYKLTEREAKLLVKNAKGFAGKRDGIKLLKGNGEINQVTRKAKTKVEKHASTEFTDKPKKPKETKPKRLSKAVYLGFYVPSLEQNRVAFLEGESVADTKKQLDSMMSNKKNLGSAGTIVKFEYDQVEDLLQRIKKSKQGFLVGPAADKIKKQGRVVERNYIPDGVVLYDETIEVPKYNDTSFEPEEPLFPGNEVAVLKEIQEEVIHNQRFTGLFKDNEAKLSSRGRIKKSKQGNPMIVFNSSTVSRKYINEAEEFIARLKNQYGSGIRGAVDVLAPSGKKPLLAVRVSIALRPYTKDKQERALKLLELSKNTQKHRVNTQQYNKLYDDLLRLEKADSTAKGNDASTAAAIEKTKQQLNKLSNELVKERLMAFNAPMYSIKQGPVFLPVEVTGIDIVGGEIFYRMVRGRRGAGSQRTTNLYSLDGSKQLI